MNTLTQDLRYGVRMLLKKPIFSIVAIITLALGIGANTAIFGIVNAVLLRPLPFPESERLMHIGRGFAPGQVYVASEPKFIYWRDQSKSFESMTAFQGTGGLNLSSSGDAEYVDGMQVTVDFFRVLGVSPILGRAFTEEEDSPSGDRVAIITNGLWRRRFAADENILGQQITLNGLSHTVVGVMPSGFRLPWSNDVYLPLRPQRGSQSGSHNWTVVGRLNAGVTEEQAAAEMWQIAESFRAEFPRMIQDKETVNLTGWQASLTSDIRQPLLILLGAVTLLLLIACANVANLQLVRAASRRKEIAIRLAVGARWGRIARQLVTEGVLLAMVGGALGALLAMWGADALRVITPSGMIPDSTTIDFDWRVLGFTLATAIITGILFGLAPAWQAVRVDVNPALREESGRGSTTSRSRLRNSLVVIEIALAFVLLVGATLLIRTFYNLSREETGFDAGNVLTFQVAPGGENYNTAPAVADYTRRAEERLRSLPGVESVAMTSNLPLDMQFNLPFMLDGQSEPSGSAQYRVISPEYFNVMKVALKSGRGFTDRDTAGTEKVIVINEGFASRYFPNSDPLGQRMCASCGFGDPEMRTIVGVVADTKQFGMAAPSPYTVFIPLSQLTDKTLNNNRRFLPLNFVMRTRVDPLTLAAAVKDEMLDLDLTQPVRSVRSMEQIISSSLTSERFNMSLLAGFAALGLMLAAIGIYGVISYSVTQRTHEIGLRMALGAQPNDVLRLVLKQGMWLAVLGVVIGLVGALAITPILKSLLFGVATSDPFTFIVIASLLTIVAISACYIPARRATKVDPMVALRYE